MKKVDNDVEFDLEHEEMRILSSLLDRMCLNGYASMEPQSLAMRLKYETIQEKFRTALELLEKEKPSA